MSDVTRILQAIQLGDTAATDQLLPLVYNELRRLAARRLRNEPAGHTLQPTALVHEAYLRLVKDEQLWESQGHFFAAAAEAMRRILVESARRKLRHKHGGGRRRVDIPAVDLVTDAPSEELLALSDALFKLEEESPERAQLIKLRYFGGMTIEEAAAAMGISRTTATRYWTFGRAWLFREMADDGNKTGPRQQE